MNQRNISWKAEWKAVGLDPGSLSLEEEALVPQLQAENRDFLAKHPFQASIHARISVAFHLWTLPLVAAAAVLLFVSLPLSTTAPPGTGFERIKGAGDPALTVYRQGKAGAEKLNPGTVVRPGDVLQAAYRVSQASQGALLSVDGSHHVTLHLSRDGRSATLTPGAEHPLEFSYELDRAPQFEVFFLIVSSRPFDLEPIRQTLKSYPWDSLRPGAFGAGIEFIVLPLNKELPR